MPQKSKTQKKLFKNINQYIRTKPVEAMETGESSNSVESDYNPVDESIIDESKINDDFLVEMIGIMLSDSSLRIISVFSYAILKKFGICSSEIRNFFPQIGLFAEQTCRDNLIKLQKSDFNHQCGGKQVPAFYDIFPEIEISKVFASAESEKKRCSFRALDLCEYTDSMFYDVTETVKECTILIRSESSVCEDLKRWGIQFDSATSIYFEGHERNDVVEDRVKFVNYFLSRNDNYYVIDSEVKWINPKEKPCVLMFHDESTF